MSSTTRRRLIQIMLATLALVSWSLFASRYGLEQSNYVLSSPKLTAPIRMVQLTDLHNSEFGEDNERLVRMVSRQHPDLILMTGDMLNGREDEKEIAVSLVRRLAEVAPVYFSYCLPFPE